MEQYTIYCTKEQAKKALELGTPLIQVPSLTIIPDGSENLKAYKYEDNLYLYPTAEQMIGWLEEQGFVFCTYKHIDKWVIDISGDDFCLMIDECNSRKEATLNAIDAALDYLIGNIK